MRYFRIILTFSFFFALTNALIAQVALEKQAQSGQNVPAIEITQMSGQSYQTAATNWEAALSQNLQNENAWLNLYKATRYAAVSNQNKKISKEQQKELSLILERMNAAIPNSFAHQYASYLNGNKSDESFDHLRAAFVLRPNEIELIDDMLCDAIITKNGDNVRKYAEQLSRLNIYNEAEVEYNKNVLNSIEQSGVLITGGNVDTYPLILMQQLQNYRTDVHIICSEWLNSKTYQATVSKFLNIESSNNLSIDRILSSGTKPIYLALTVPSELLQKQSGKLFCTGLAMKFSQTQIENLTSLAYNWEFLFAKTQIQNGEQLNRNYLVPLILLRDFYTSTGKNESVSDIQNLAIQISQRFSLEKQVNKHLD